MRTRDMLKESGSHYTPTATLLLYKCLISLITRLTALSSVVTILRARFGTKRLNSAHTDGHVCRSAVTTNSY